MQRAARLSGQVPGHERQVPHDWVAIVNWEETPLHVQPVAGGYRVDVNSAPYTVLTDWRPGEPLVRAQVNEQDVCFQQDKHGPSLKLYRRGAEIDLLVCTPQAAELHRHMLEKVAPDLSKFLLSPMPGLLVKLVAAEGAEIKAGEELAVVEAMKMENSLRATEDVVISRVLAEEGASLVVDQPILEFE